MSFHSLEEECDLPRTIRISGVGDFVVLELFISDHPSSGL